MNNMQETIISENTIIHGDCLDILPKISTGGIDFILCDPPYLVSYKDRAGRRIQNDDNDTWLKPAFAEMYRVLAKNSFCISFYGWPHVDRFMAAWKAAGFRIVGHLVFPKRYTSTTRHLRYQHECAYVLAKGFPQEPAYPIGDVIEFAYSGNKLHPTEKPLSALLPLVETFSKPGALVCDPFAGSGSSLHASKALGRKYIGIELDSVYHKLAAERLAAVL
jgi:DNA modification methylase